MNSDNIPIDLILFKDTESDPKDAILAIRMTDIGSENWNYLYFCHIFFMVLLSFSFQPAFLGGLF